VVFAGTFTAGGLKQTIEDGALNILQEGRAQKFGERVQQVTFSGKVAAARGTPVLYVTERCVFRLTAAGLELIEVAPGIDIERDIVTCMGFQPIIRRVRPMDPRLFRTEPMNLKNAMLDLNLTERLAYDAERNILFLNFEGLHVRRPEDITAIKDAVVARCTEIGRRTAAVVNYDSFRLEEDVADQYADMVYSLEQQYYTRVSRYATSAFMRVKLRQTLTRTVRPHIFENSLEAQSFHSGVSDEPPNGQDHYHGNLSTVQAAG
jgi:propionate CoA-transferase